MDIVVGTFNTPSLYSLRFTPPSPLSPATFRVLKHQHAVGSHSWLALSPAKNVLYCTAWTEPPSIVAYAVSPSAATSQDTASAEGTAPQLTLINSATIASRSGYVAVHPAGKYLYSAGGPSGEVFTLRDDGDIGDCIQRLAFLEQDVTTSQGLPHGDFGGLRHGAHSVDLSPDGRYLYVADIGRNCIWTYTVNESVHTTSNEHLISGGKHIAPRHNDGPRHTTPHPNGKVLYSLQEHSSMVDAFHVGDDGVTLQHCSGVKIIPQEKAPEDYWADEVRLSTSCGRSGRPKYIYASTRGLKDDVKGYVAAIAIDEGGQLGQTLHIWETPTSGGWANAVEPAPAYAYGDSSDGDDTREWIALTDSQEGYVFILAFDGTHIEEVARVKLEAENSGEVISAATAIWL